MAASKSLAAVVNRAFTMVDMKLGTAIPMMMASTAIVTISSMRVKPRLLVRGGMGQEHPCAWMVLGLNINGKKSQGYFGGAMSLLFALWGSVVP
jgi:hypothetical protein